MDTKKSCRFIIHATGKNGETYLTSCRNKWEVKQWVEENQAKLNKKELKVVDKHKKKIIAKNIFILTAVLFAVFQIYLLL